MDEMLATQAAQVKILLIPWANGVALQNTKMNVLFIVTPVTVQVNNLV